MSDTFCHIVPTDPQWTPGRSGEDAALRAFDAEVFAAVAFIDQGENWTGARCPSCCAAQTSLTELDYGEFPPGLRPFCAERAKSPRGRLDL